MKITQAQIRVIIATLQSIAARQCETAEKLWRDSAEANESRLEALAKIIQNKYEAKLRKSIRVEIEVNSYRSRFEGLRVSARLNDSDVEAVQKEFEAQCEKLGLRGGYEVVRVDFPALGLTDAKRGFSALRVPKGLATAWEKRSKQIDAAFMDGDAKRLLNLIQSFE